MWFKVDDSFHSHPKAAAASLEALGLWTLAGSWSGNHLTDGFVPDHMLPSLSRGNAQLADELVAAGLWRRTKGGYRFHQWADRNPTKAEAHRVTEKIASGGLLGNHLRWHVKGKTYNNDCKFCQEKQASGTDRPTDRGGDRVPESGATPDPTRPEEPKIKNSSPKNGEDPEGFADLWATLPRRTARAAAVKAYRAALKKTTAERILVGARSYRDECARLGTATTYIKHPSTWLNGECWDDEPAYPTAPDRSQRFPWDN